MKLPSLLLSLSLSFAVSFPASAERPPAEFTMSTQGELTIAPDGSVKSWKMDGAPLSDEVQSLLERNVATWRFEPILRDGQPVTARTRMSINLEAVPQGDGYVMKVAHVFFGSVQSRGKTKPPSYPTPAIRAGVGARVMVAVKIDAEGNVVAMHPQQTSLSARGTAAQERRFRSLFEQASMTAVQDWKYVPGESIGGVTIGSSFVVPIEYTLRREGEPRPEGRWRAYSPGPVTPAPWVQDDSMAEVDTDGLAEGQAAALDSPFRLKSDVIGKAL